MSNPFSRILLSVSAALLIFGGVVHALAFKKAVAVPTASNLPAFYANAFKGLWLIDSATLLAVAIVFTFVSVRSTIASGSIVCVVALIPGATAVLLYCFMGGFMPAHLCLVAAMLAFFAGLMLASA